MIDIHSHILHGLDDGATSLDESIAMVRMAGESGTTAIVGTPHSNSRFKFDFDVVRAKAAELAAALPEIAIHSGCDFHLSIENLQDAFKNPRKYTIAQQQYLLVEFPDIIGFNTTPQIFAQLRAAGMIPIVTHPERNAYLQAKTDELARWVEEGAFVQVTAQSFLGLFGRKARDAAHQLMKRNLVHFVASDGHNLTQRTTSLREAYDHVADKYEKETAELLFVSNPGAVVSGDAITLDEAPRRKRWWS